MGEPAMEGAPPESIFDLSGEFGQGWIQGVSVPILNAVRQCLLGSSFGGEASVLEVIESQTPPFDQSAGQEVVNAIALDIQRAVAERLAVWLFENWKQHGRRQLVEPKAAALRRPAGRAAARGVPSAGGHGGGLLVRFEFQESDPNIGLFTRVVHSRGGVTHTGAA